ncbi:MAG: hypothetical protein ACAH95_17010 [Fimbriimonas sp.]
MTALALLLFQTLAGGQSILADNVHLVTPVAGLERTHSEVKVVNVDGPGFTRALRVHVKDRSNETNITQLTLPNATVVEQGDTLLASVWLKGPGQAEFLFEKSTDPWTKSVTRGLSVPSQWRRFLIPFRSAQTYNPGEAMVSLRLAFGPQTIDIGAVDVVSYGKTKTLDQLVEYAISQSPLGEVRVDFNLKNTNQTMLGFGGNFCQPRYGSTEPMDVVGNYALNHLNVVHARIGLPLNSWNPSPGVYRDDAQAKASLEALQIMARRGIPTVVSVWEGPTWMLGGNPEQNGRILPREKYRQCIDAIAEYLVVARDKYRANVGYFSFNEADYGVNFKFSPQQIADFIRQAGPVFESRGLKTKFLVGDTANASNFVGYATPLLEDRSIARFLGPLAFHNWDALSASEQAYTGIAALGKKYGKPVWCLEAGHDAQLWQAKDPWADWENGLRLAMAYERTIRQTNAVLMDYWTYQDNYPLVDKQGPKPYHVFHVMKQMENVFAPGSKVVNPKISRPGLQAIGTVGKRFALLLVNSEGPGAVTLTGLPKNARVQVLVNSRDRRNLVRTAKVDSRGMLRVRVPMRSVLSIRQR